MKQLFVVEHGTTVKDIAELPNLAGGRAAKPRQPFAFHGADGSAAMVAGLGVTEAAEMQDLAYAQHAVQEQRAKETTEERRARLGLPAPWTKDEFHEYMRNVGKAKAKREEQLHLDPDGRPHEKRVF